MTYKVAKTAYSGDFTSPAQCWRRGHLSLTLHRALLPELTYAAEPGLPGLFKVYEFHLPRRPVQP
jgi:hypothetical protein